MTSGTAVKGVPVAFTPVRKTSAYESIVAQVERSITSGELRAGDRLPGERQLMETFSVSRATVREALRVLQATGVVESRHGDPRGPVVVGLTPEVLERPLARLASQHLVTRAELLQFRLVVDGHAALLAAVRQDPAALEAVESCAAAIADVADDPGTTPAVFGDRVSQLHEAVRAAGGNHLLQASGAAVRDVLADLVARRLEDDADRAQRMRRSAEDALRLAALVRAGDARGAQHAATDNIYRYYADELTEAERAALEPLVLPL